MCAKIANDETTPSSSLQLINSTNTAAATPPPISHDIPPTGDGGANHTVHAISDGVDVLGSFLRIL